MQSIRFLSLAPQHDLIRAELEEGFRKVMDRSAFVLNGEVEAFEREYADYSGVKYCVGVANGMDALYISLKVLGVGKGHEVIVPALTCAPTWMAVSRTGAVLVPVEVHPDTYCIDETGIQSVITSKTKAIVPVNLYGRPAALPALVSLSESKGIALVEDNAQGHGASIQGKKTGSFGRINATSFYPTKNLGALGDGGAITTDDFGLYKKAMSFRNYGSERRFHHNEIGINSRLDELQAVFLRTKLKHLDAWNIQRQTLAHVYQDLLRGAGDLILPTDIESILSNYHLFVIRSARRDELRKFLESHGIETDVHYPVPPHLQPAYHSGGFSRGQFPLTEKICETILSLPLWPGMTEQHVVYISQCVKSFFR